MHVEIIKNTINKLKTLNNNKQYLVGFDGFVDVINHVVAKRTDANSFEREETISEFSKRIASAAGLSANIELFPVQRKIGGNGPILAGAILAQSGIVSYFGALGKETVDPVFEDFVSKCKNVVSLTNPGYTDALEFFDGKLMFGKMNSLYEVNWDNIILTCGEEKLIGILKDVSLVAFANWTMLSGMNSIINGIDYLLKKIKIKPFAFFDLADPYKRSDEDIENVLNIISSFSCLSVLSMNESESVKVSQVLGLSLEKDILKRAEAIYQKLNIHSVVIHPVDGAAIVNTEESIWTKGPYTTKPLLTTGAGDNFNAGLCSGVVHGLLPSESLMLAVCTSGFYVRNGYSPSIEELINFMTLWLNTDI